MRSFGANKVVVSAFLSTLRPEVNEERHARLYDALKAAGGKPRLVMGRYKGEKEKGYMMESTEAQRFKELIDLAKKQGAEYGQRCVLVVHHDGKSESHDLPTGEILPVGWARGVSEAEAVDLPSYTHEPDTGAYWVCE